MPADLVLGIDPGLNGALALVEIGTGRLVEVYDMPVLTLKSKRELDGYKLAHIIDSHAHEIAEVWIERVWSMPGEGAVQGFAFGEVYGLLRGVCMASFLPLHEVVPTVWKKAAGVKGEKDESRKVASVRWPLQSSLWPLVKHHGRADAALIADHGLRQLRVEAA